MARLRVWVCITFKLTFERINSLTLKVTQVLVVRQNCHSLLFSTQLTGTIWLSRLVFKSKILNKRQTEFHFEVKFHYHHNLINLFFWLSVPLWSSAAEMPNCLKATLTIWSFRQCLWLCLHYSFAKTSFNEAIYFTAFTSGCISVLQLVCIRYSLKPSNYIWKILTQGQNSFTNFINRID